MFNFFRTRDKLGKQTQSADVHNPIRRSGGGVGYYNEAESFNEIAFWRASSLRNAEEVKRLSGLLAIHNDRYAKQMAGLKKATKASADKRRKV